MVKIYNKKNKKVVCLNTGEVFESIKEASNKYKTYHIHSCCKNKISYSGKDKYGNKLIWRYLEEYNNLTEDEITSILNYNKVVCLNTRETFNSIKEAANKYNINYSNIYYCCTKKSKSAGMLNGDNLVWYYYKDYINLTKDEINNIIYSSGGKSKVICLNTKEIFNSIVEASKKYNISASCISNCCNGFSTKAGNMVWRHYKDYIKLTEADINFIIENIEN